MFDVEVDKVNASGAFDFEVASATSERLVVDGFVDHRESLRCRLIFEEPYYVQMPWRFTSRTLEAQPARALLDSIPASTRWILPERDATPDATPSLTREALEQAASVGGAVFIFRSRDTWPAEPSCVLVARRILALSSGEEG